MKYDRFMTDAATTAPAVVIGYMARIAWRGTSRRVVKVAKPRDATWG